MAIGPRGGAASELDVVRCEYESSLSWRVTRPLRALGRSVRSWRDGASEEVAESPAADPAAGRYDAWLVALHGDDLARIEAACAAGGADCFPLFRELDADLWALLLTQEYSGLPHIRALLPSVPEPGLQELYNGASGVRLASQGVAFYRRLCARYAQWSDRPLHESRVLDFGCGWGRLTRMLARDAAPGRLFGCDPVESILDVCRANGVPARLARSEHLPDRVPFDEHFDLAVAFSVFTHLSEHAHERCLQALHDAVRPGGILVVTVRPAEYLRFCALMHPVLASLGPDPAARLQEPRYLFAPHSADVRHPQYAGGKMSYGEAVVTLPYIRSQWSPRFSLLGVDVLVGDLFQVMVTLRRH